MTNYTDALRAHNLKATPQRLEIVSTLQAYGHMSVDSLYEILLKKFNSISLATIYKNINLMLENSFIEEVKLPNKKSVYELTKKAHSHLLCSNCGAVEDITLDLSYLITNATSSSHYKIQKTDLIFSGLCQKCQ